MSTAAAVIPDILYQNDIGTDPVSHLELARTQSTRVVPFPVQRPRTGAELLPSIETLATIERLSQYVTKSQLFQKRFSNADQVIVTLLKGHDLGITFADALEHVYVVNGKPGVSGQLMLRMIYSRVSNPRNETLVEFTEIGAEKAVVRMRRPGGEWVARSFTIQQAEKAGLLWKWKDKEKVENFVWHAYREDMLLWRAVAKCARLVFADAIGGIYFYDELISGPLNDPMAVVPGSDTPPVVPEPKPAKTSKKPVRKRGGNGLSDEQRAELQKALDAASMQMDPDWRSEVAKDQEARFKKTRRMIYDDACQRCLHFVPEHIEPEQATKVVSELGARARKWAPVIEAIESFAKTVSPDSVDDARRRIWNEAWKVETKADPKPESIASADAALADRMLAGVTQNHERFLAARNKDGQDESK